MSDNYDGNTLADLIDTHPADVDFVGTAAPAIRQIKRFLRNQGTNGVCDVVFRWICERLFPVGAYYITEDSSNPGDRFGGTWEKVKGKFLLGSSEITDDVYTVGNEGGEKEHTLTVEEMPKHTHGANYSNGGGKYCQTWRKDWGANSGDGQAGHTDEFVDIAGGDQPHNNMPPYRVVNIWRKVSNE